MSKKLLPIDFILIAITLVWGFNFTVVKFSLNEMTPFFFNAVRYFLAILTMWIILIKQGRTIKLIKEDRWPVLGLSLLGHFIYQAFFIIGLNMTKAANGAIMLGTIPIWIAIVSHFFFDEQLNRQKTLGIVVAFTGLAFIIGFRNEGFQFSSKGLWGDILMLGSAFSFALYTLYSKQYLKKYDTTELTTLSMTAGGIWIVFAGVPSFIAADFSQISALAWTGALYSGVLSIAISYFIWNYGLKLVGAVRTSAYQNLAPVFGVLFGVLLLKEDMNMWQLTGAAVTLSGVIITRLG
jgi:drug/metabolite transporter (DMT)-like permease